MALAIHIEMFKHSWTSQCYHVSESFRYPSFTDEKTAVAVIIAVYAINTLFSAFHSSDSSITQTSGLLGVLHVCLPSYVSEFALNGKQVVRSELKGSVCWPILIIIV